MILIRVLYDILKKTDSHNDDLKKNEVGHYPKSFYGIEMVLTRNLNGFDLFKLS